MSSWPKIPAPPLAAALEPGTYTFGAGRILPLPHRASADVLTSTLVSLSESNRASGGGAAAAAAAARDPPSNLALTGLGGVCGSRDVSSNIWKPFWKPFWKPPKGTGEPSPPCASRESNPASKMDESTAVFRDAPPPKPSRGAGEAMRASTSTPNRPRCARVVGGVRVSSSPPPPPSSSSARRESSEARSCASQSSSSSMSSSSSSSSSCSSCAMPPMWRNPPLLALPRVPPVDLRVSLERSTGGGVHPTPSAPGVGPKGAVVGAPNGVMGSSSFVVSPPGDMETSPPKPGVVSTERFSAGSMSTDTGDVISAPGFAPPSPPWTGVTPKKPPTPRGAPP